MKFLTFFLTTLALSAAAVHAGETTNKALQPPAPNGASLAKKATHRLAKHKTKAVVEDAAKEAPKPATEKGGS